MFTNKTVSTAKKKKKIRRSAHILLYVFFSYRIELKLILLDAEDDEEFDDIVCSSK